MIDFENGQWGKKATIRTPWNSLMLSVLLSSNIRELELNWGKGWKGEVEFLRRLPDLRSLTLIDRVLDHIEPVHVLHRLLDLKLLTYSDSPVDFDSFPELQTLDFEWIKGSNSLFNRESLRSLSVNSYKGKSSAPFGKLTRLDSLWIANSPIKDLTGLSPLQDLSYLSLKNLRSLASLDGIEELRNLKVLEMHACPKIDVVTKIFELDKLERLLLLAMGRIESIRGIENLTDLKSFLFYGSTDIVDGDLSPIKRLPKLSDIHFANRKHYSHKFEEFDVLNAANRGLS